MGFTHFSFGKELLSAFLDPGGVEKADSGRSKSNVLCPPWLGKEGDACGYTFVRGGCQPTLAEAQSQMESFYSKTDCAVIKMASGNSDFTRRIGDKLPWFDPARPWSEKEIQDELGLTTEERQWIEDHIESSL